MTKAEYDRKVLSLKGTHDYDMLCFIRGQYITELEAEVTNLNDWLTTWKESLNLAQAEIAKLKAIAVVWHRYPEEKPEPDTRHLVVVNGNVHISRYDAEQDIDKINVTHWAYLPAPPEEVK